jgi:hypothetical protein
VRAAADVAVHTGATRGAAVVVVARAGVRRARVEALLQRLRAQVRDALGVATTLGFGPRFLHSTGQLHKGGPDSGVYLQITAEPRKDLPIPGWDETFGMLIAAQALGDLQSLQRRNRRALRLHFAEADDGLRRLEAMVAEALSGLMTA